MAVEAYAPPVTYPTRALTTASDEGRAVLVYSRSIAVVGADYVAEEGARGFAHELVSLGPHPENYGVNYRLPSP